MEKEAKTYPLIEEMPLAEEPSSNNGDGTKENPFLISNKNDFFGIRNNLAAFYKLAGDLDFNGEQIETIGKTNTFGAQFTGGLDGGGHTIWNFRISSDSQYTGLFGNVSNAVLKDLRIENAQVEQTRSSDTGVLAGYLSNCTVENITFIDSSVSGLSSTGALAGHIYGGSVAGCSIRGNTTVNGTTSVGGLLGYVRNYATVRECSAAGNVTGQSQVGGLIGSFSWESVVQECCAEGTVTGAERVGGLVGEASGTIENSYAAGVVVSTKLTQAGGLIGFTNGVQIRNSYAACQVSENGNGLIGIVWGSSGVKVTNAYYDGPLSGALQKDGYNKGKLTVAMLKSSSYEDWDFEKVWDIEEGVSYPYLRSIGRLNETAVDRGTVTEGAGTQEAPYLVESREAFESIRYDLDGSYKLTVDIDFNGEQIETIGKSNTLGACFTGGLDGGGHTIRNFRISSDSSYTGLFGYVSNAIVKDLRIEKAQVEQTKSPDTGVLAGYLSNCTVEKITIRESVVAGAQWPGGLAGELYRCTAADIRLEDVQVSGAQSVGGLAAKVNGGTILRCCVSGKSTVTGTGTAGGLIGSSSWESVIQECCAEGTVTGAERVGGLVGEASGTIENSYAAGVVVSTKLTQAGGLIGFTNGVQIRNSYAACRVSENGNGLIGIVWGSSGVKVTNAYYDGPLSGALQKDGYNKGKLTVAMLRRSSYEDWDFEKVWDIEEGVSYPYLRSIGRLNETAVDKGAVTKGAGTQEAPYLIESREAFESIRYDLDGSYKLTVDIDFNGEQIETIGKTNTFGAQFTGGLDGGGHAIRNFRISSDSQYTGVFGFVRDAILKNLRIENAQVEQTRSSDTGGLAGYLSNCTVENITFLDGSVSGVSNTGALAGHLYGGSVAGCSIRGNTTVNGITRVGGLLGYVWNLATIRECSAAGKVTGQSQVGGLIGDASANITDCCTSCQVVSTANHVQTAGLAGNGSGGTIKNCFAVGSISENGSGLAYIRSATVMKVINSYFNSEAAGKTIPETQARTTQELMDKENYIDWDWDSIWIYKENTYPAIKRIEINNRESFALRFRDLTGFSVLLEWDEVPGAQEYMVSYLNKTFYSTVPQILLTDLLPDTSYEFRVQTEIAANIIVRSKVLKLRTKKFGITGVHCISKDDNSLQLTWEEAEDAQSYEVLCNGNSQITSENTCTLSQLNKDIPYVICIRTLLKDGTVAESDSIVEKIYALDPKTEYAAEFIDKCQGQRWFMDEIEYLLNLKGKSINTIHSRRDFATIYAIGLAGRGISGTIPPAIGELRQLEYLYLGNNNLSGILPEELALLDQLKEMDLTGNQLADQ